MGLFVKFMLKCDNDFNHQENERFIYAFSFRKKFQA